jgi:hypothetical protein
MHEAFLHDRAPTPDLFLITGHATARAYDFAEEHPAFVIPLHKFREDLVRAFKGRMLHLWPHMLNELD